MGKISIGMAEQVIDKRIGNALGTYVIALVTRKFVSTYLPVNNQMET